MNLYTIALVVSCANAIRFYHLKPHYIVAQADFKGFNSNDSPVVLGDGNEWGNCQASMDEYCYTRDLGVSAVLCDATPESAAHTGNNPTRTRLGDVDGVLRTFYFYTCSSPTAGGPTYQDSHYCSDADAYGPFLCLQEEGSATSAEGSMRCTCWPREDWRGLSHPLPHRKDSISDRFPLDRYYPTTPREYNG